MAERSCSTRSAIFRLALQPKLLRFVQDREYERVGDHKTRRADVRVLAATNVNLEDAMKAGRFREDLLYRIKVIEITLPPLRDRPDDVSATRGPVAPAVRQTQREALQRVF